MLEALAVLLLLAVLTVAVVRPRGISEGVVAVPAAALVVAVGAVSWSHARAEVDRLGPVVAFLAAVLVLADGCADEGLFRALGALVGRAAHASARRLLVGVFAAAAATTAVLSLDTTVVLLTPVVVATARAAGVRPRPHTYACGHLANSGSLLLPVSNLTNLLALAVVPISFLRFAALMALPWAGALLVELVALLRWFRRDLDAAAAPPVPVPVPVPRFALAVVALTLAGFVAASLTGLSPVWVAVAGALVLVGWRLLRRRTTPARVVASAAPSFCLFVLALGVVVRAASDHGLGAAVRHAFPSGNGLAALLLVALFSAAVANLVNNLPATLLLLPVAATGGVGPVLAVLVGVNIGPNLTYAGSLATLLWRRVLADSDAGPRWREFSAIGAVTTPLAIGAASLLLWLSLRAFGAT